MARMILESEKCEHFDYCRILAFERTSNNFKANIKLEVFSVGGFQRLMFAVTQIY